MYINFLSIGQVAFTLYIYIFNILFQIIFLEVSFHLLDFFSEIILSFFKNISKSLDIIRQKN